MCTLVLLHRPAADWPLLLAANRDEQTGRAWRPPARHWPDRPEVVAGIDLTAYGSWLGLNDQGVVAAVLNRVGALGPQPGKRSRGELVLEALDHAEAEVAATALSELDPEAYRPFNLIIADRERAFWLRHAGGLPSFGYRAESGAWHEIEPVRMPGGVPAAGRGGITCHPLPAGLSMITARDRNDPGSPRVRHYLPRFAAAPVPDPARDDWAAWAALLADRQSPDGDPTNAMTIVTDSGFGTVCSQLIGVPAQGQAVMKFAAGRPGEVPFETVAL